MQDIGAIEVENRNASLLRSVAEQLKTPLSIIARQSELYELSGRSRPLDHKAIYAQATTALTLVESYLLGLQLLHQQAELPLEPVSTSSLLVEVAHELDLIAKHYDVGLRVQVAGKYPPVMANQRGLRSALISLGYALLESYPLKNQHLTVAVHQTPHGIVTGVYGSYEQLDSRQWRRALALQGRASQPFKAMSSGSGAGIFVADAILQAMATRLRVGKYLHEYGLATTLQVSQQLQFV